MRQVQWDTVRKGTKVTLSEAATLKGFNGERRRVEAGPWYITGFWADICGLNRHSAGGANEVCIQARELSRFTTRGKEAA